MSELYFKNIVGYETEKNELSLIIDWCKDKELINNKFLNLPNGILFYGEPGNGKSLFISAIHKQFKDNSYIIEGNGDNDATLTEIYDKYTEAKQNDFSIVLIDEIDKLIEKDNKIQRLLQSCIDGVDKDSGKVLTIASANELYRIPDSLLRPGRFDRLIMIERPMDDERDSIVKYYLDKLGLDYSDVDFDSLDSYIHNSTCAELMSICNDCFLRNRVTKITTEMLIKSSCVIKGSLYNQYIDKNEFKTKQMFYIAIHEVGHVLISIKNKDYFSFKIAQFHKNGDAATFSFPRKDIYKSYITYIKDIEILLAGSIAEKIIFKNISTGTEDDFVRAKSTAQYLVNKLGVNGKAKLVLKRFDNYERMETEKTKLRNERIAERIINKCTKEVYRYLKPRRDEIIRLSNLMCEKGNLTKEDFKDYI